MRIVIDLQGAQCESRHRGIGRYSLALALAMVRNRGGNEVIIALNGLFSDTIEPIRAAFDGLLPQENIRIWFAAGPVHSFDTSNDWRRHTAELIRESFLESLEPDIVHVSSLFEGFGDNSVHSIGKFTNQIPTAVTFYDLIPLIQRNTYLDPNPFFEKLYMEKLEYLRRADLFLAISESSRMEVIEQLGVPAESAINISAAADAHFKKIYLDDDDVVRLRNQFGLTRPFIMYSGATDERKNHLRLIKAFSQLPSGLRGQYQLAIVGGLPNDHRAKFEEYIKLCGLTLADVIITGRVTDEQMLRLYNICSLFVFPSWHEGFGLPALEAMSCGAPVIGSQTTSLPEVIGRQDALFNPFSVKSISKKMTEVLLDKQFCGELSRHGLEQAKNFSWDKSARIAIAAFEQFHSNNLNKSKQLKLQAKPTLATELIDRIAKLDNPPSAQIDWLITAQAISKNQQSSVVNRLLIDISELVQRDARTGIQRVVRSVLAELLAHPPEGFKVVPIYATHGQNGYRHATNFCQRFERWAEISISTSTNDEPLEVSQRDIFIGLDLHHIVLHQADFYRMLRSIGAQVYFMVYDLVPIMLPKLFPLDIPRLHSQWLSAISNADGVICISRSVADEMTEWLSVFGPARIRPLKIGWIHLGADVACSVPTIGLPPEADLVLNELAKRPSFLSVGTIEPRKGQMQTLLAFERLWAQGEDVNLVIVGKKGWNVDLLVEILRSHSELNRRLFWLEGISDEYLEKVYATCSCLVAASEGEGFGLPLIEAAQHKLPIIARDIPVFREVAGENAYYFSGVKPDALANCVRTWITLNQAKQAPQSDKMPWLTWKQSTQNLLDVMLGGQWYKQWMPDGVHRYWGGDDRLGTQVGKRSGQNIASTGHAGYLIFGPYLPLESGQYQIFIRGIVGDHGVAGARIDAAVEGGTRILAESALHLPDEAGKLSELHITLDKPCTDLEIRVWVEEASEVTISLLEIQPSQTLEAESLESVSTVGAETTSTSHPHRDDEAMHAVVEVQKTQAIESLPIRKNSKHKKRR